jgi:hypothetical protein
LDVRRHVALVEVAAKCSIGHRDDHRSELLTDVLGRLPYRDARADPDLLPLASAARLEAPANRVRLERAP